MQDFETGGVEQFDDEFEGVLERGEEGIALNVTLDQCEIQVGTQWQRLLVNLSAAADEDLAAILRVPFPIQSRQIRDGFDAGDWSRRAGQDNRGAVWQRFADGIESFAAHDDDMAGGHFFEPLEIFGKVPGQIAAGPDHPVEGHRGDGFEGPKGIHRMGTDRLEALAKFRN
jgi:hypothetical protein